MEKNNSTKFCVISLLCMFIVPIISLLFSGGNGDISGTTGAAWNRMLLIDIASYIAAWGLAILARVRYKTRFSLVLIIMYGALLSVSIIGVIVLAAILLGK